MENLNLHKSKLYALAIAAVALIAMLLPWQTVKIAFDLGGFGGGAGGRSVNGFHGWGWISLLGILAVVAGSLMGDKTKDYDANTKMITLTGFGGIALGAVIFMIRVMGVKSGNGFKSSTGFGLFICLVAGVIGLLLVMGLVKMPAKPAAPPAPPK
ncbi:MAG TPA: hypothetical protein VLJ68_06325 [Chitinophagaceae bacterium]|nr:hypothetical protein [Chitinophagaceae bacterium]